MDSHPPLHEAETLRSLAPLQALFDIAAALLLFVFAALVAPLLGQVLLQRFDLPLLLILAFQGLLVLIGLGWLLAQRGQGWRQIGLRRLRARDLGLGLVALLAIFAINLLINVLISPLAPDVLQEHQEGLAAVAGMLAGETPPLAVAAAMLLIGFYEEALARGFLLARCRTLLPGTWGPVLLSSALFGLGHFYQGWFGVLQTALVGLVFARLALHWGTLWPVIFAHAALNTLSLLLLRTLVQ